MGIGDSGQLDSGPGESGGLRIIGQSHEAPGGFGQYFLLTEVMTQRVPSDLPDELVSIADAISVGWSYVSRAAVTPKEVPLVLGCGAIGLSAIASLKRLGMGPIVAVDFVASRRQTALTMGADVVVDPAEVSPYAAWRELAYGSSEPVRDMMNLLDLPSCVVFECVGVPGVLDSIVKGCERGTRIFSAGGPPEGDHVHTMVAKRKGLNIQFGGGPSMTHWNEAFEEVCSGRLDVTPMFGWKVDLEEVGKAIDDARDANGPARIIVVPWMMRVGIIGTGAMGRPLVDRLQSAQFDVVAFARRQEVRAELVGAGVPCVDDVSLLARDRDVVIIYLYNDEQVRDMVLDSPLAEAMEPGSVVVVHTTASPGTIEAIDAALGPRGVGVVDAPGSGGPAQVGSGDLTLFVGGRPEIVDRCAPLFAAYASQVVRFGGPGVRAEGKAPQQPALRRPSGTGTGGGPYGRGHRYRSGAPEQDPWYMQWGQLRPRAPVADGITERAAVRCRMDHSQGCELRPRPPRPDACRAGLIRGSRPRQRCRGLNRSTGGRSRRGEETKAHPVKRRHDGTTRGR